jgi:D-sedoheptulose 7-phosphate isomerase
MPSPDTTLGAKEAAHALQTPHALPDFFTALWLGVQAAAQTVFRRDPAPATSSDSNYAPTSPKAYDLAPRGPRPDSARTRANTPAFVANYSRTLDAVWQEHDWNDVVTLVETLRRCWRENRQVFLCGNGGSAANAIHLANDLLYGIDKASGRGLRVTALPANAAVLTCLANDIAYADVFAQQLTVLANAGDVLIAFSGSGNSPNIVKALERARELGVTSFAILGFTGGRALALAEHPIYFPVHDMQVAEDLQMMVGHMAMQSLARSGR